MKIWNHDIYNTARTLMIVADNEPVIVGAPPLSQQEQLHVSKLVSQVLALLAALPARMQLSHFSYATQALKMPAALANIILCQERNLMSTVFARADLVREQGQWKLLEMNVGSSVGGMFYSSLPRLSGLAQSYDALKIWGELITRNYCQGIQHIAIVEDKSLVGELRPQFAVLANELQQQSNLNCSVVSADELWLEENQLFCPNGKIDCIYRFFSEHDVINDPESYTAVMTAIKHEWVSLPMGFSTNLLSNKGTLALLYQLLETSLLTRAEKCLVKSIVPETLFVSPDTLQQLIAEPDKWILKPTDSACGNGVMYGGEMESKIWRAQLEQICRSPETPYIAQRFCEPESYPVIFSNGEGSNFTENASVVWGVYIYGESYLGTLVRAKSSQCTVVINHAAGASVGPLNNGSDEYLLDRLSTEESA